MRDVKNALVRELADTMREKRRNDDLRDEAHDRRLQRNRLTDLYSAQYALACQQRQKDLKERVLAEEKLDLARLAEEKAGERYDELREKGVQLLELELTIREQLTALCSRKGCNNPATHCEPAGSTCGDCCRTPSSCGKNARRRQLASAAQEEASRLALRQISRTSVVTADY